MLIPQSVLATGYSPRACPFDMNGDGIIGGVGDCNVCDGNPHNQDPDGDNQDEWLVYVDCQNGDDNNSCGSPDAPCQTLKHALEDRVDQAPEDRGEAIVCFTGTCMIPGSTPVCKDQTCDGKRKTGSDDAYAQIDHSGIQKCGEFGPGCLAKDAAYYTRQQDESRLEQRDFQYPMNPAMLIGWDTDGDGEYPPVDPDDKSVITNGGIGGRKVFASIGRHDKGVATTSAFEAAAFTVKNWSNGCCSDGNTFWSLNDTLSAKWLYFHDIKLDEVNSGNETDGNNAVWLMFKTRDAAFWAFENLDGTATDKNAGGIGGRVWRGACESPGEGGNIGGESGPFRFAHSTLEHQYCNNTDAGVHDTKQCNPVIRKIWGWCRGAEDIDNVYTARVDLADGTTAENGNNKGNGSLWGCSVRDIDIVGNRFQDFSPAITFQPDLDKNQDTPCGAGSSSNRRRADDIIATRNIIRLDGVQNEPQGRTWGIYVESAKGGEWDETIDGLRIENNTIFALGDKLHSCINLGPGYGGPSGSCATNHPFQKGWKIFGNTCYGNPAGKQKNGSLSIFGVDGTQACKAPVEIKNNIFAGIREGRDNIGVKGGLWSNLDVNFNVYDPKGGFEAGQIDVKQLKDWRQETAAHPQSQGLDKQSFECEPAFVSLPTGDIHLLEDDNCARNRATTLASATVVDIDGEKRDAPWDVGADEVFSPTTTTTTTLPQCEGPIGIDAEHIRSACAGAGKVVTIPDFVVGDQQNRILVVGIAAEDSDGDCNAAAATVKYGNKPASVIVGTGAVTGQQGWRNCVALFALNSPPSGASPISVTFPGSVESATIGAMTVFNALQQDAESANASTVGTATISTGITTSTAGTMIVDVVAANNPGAITEGPNQTKRWMESCTLGKKMTGAGSILEKKTAGQTTMSWQHNNAARMAHAVAAFASSKEGPCSNDSDCDDKDVCTDDYCVNGECGHTNNTVPCRFDSIDCTDDVCRNGRCVAEANQTNCQSGEICDEQSGCVTTTTTTTTTVSTTTTTILLPVRLLSSGQTLTYESGDDGAEQRGVVRSFTNNGDGTVTDKASGLVWELKDDADGIHDRDKTYCWDPAKCPGNSIWDFLAGINQENGTGFAGHNDWRIPNRRELESLTDIGRFQPAINPIFHRGCTEGCKNTTCACSKTGPTWSSSTHANESNLGWAVTSDDGAVRTENKSTRLVVRAVRTAR